jgi:hypothetical protein
MKDRITDIKFYYDLDNWESDHNTHCRILNAHCRILALFSCTIDNLIKIRYMSLRSDENGFSIHYPEQHYFVSNQLVPFFEILDIDTQCEISRAVIGAYKKIMDDK